MARAAPRRDPHVVALTRHFADLRDGTHAGQSTRGGKEHEFRRAVALLDAPARRTLLELDDGLLKRTGTIASTGPVRSPDGGLAATWTLSWPAQRAAKLEPVTLLAHYGRTFHHPHLRGGIVGEWPLNVLTAQDARAQLPVLRAIATADLHNLVYQRDYTIIPAVATGS